MNVELSLEVVLRGEGTSTYDAATINRRLAQIESDSEEAAYLRSLLEREQKQ